MLRQLLLRRLRPKSRVAISYARDRDFWIERVLLAPVPGSSSLWVTLSHDLEWLEEDLEGTDIYGIVETVAGVAPRGVDASQFLGLAEALGRDLEESELDEQVKGARMMVGALEVPPASAAPLPLGVDELTRPRDAAGISGGAASSGGENVNILAAALRGAGSCTARAQWVVAVPGHGYIAGDPLPAGGSLHTFSSKGVLVLPNDIEIFVCSSAALSASGQMVVSKSGFTEAAAKSEAGRPESRVLPITRDLQGNRFREFRSTMGHFTGDTSGMSDNPVSGPSTFVWLMRHFCENGGSPTAFHQRWLSDVRLDYQAAGTQEHQTLCKAIELMISIDQIDGSKMVFAEVMARKIQVIHDRWKHKMASLAANGGKDGEVDETYLLLGVYETRGNIGVAPALSRWLADELGREAAVAKERRRAREERALAAAKK